MAVYAKRKMDCYSLRKAVESRGVPAVRDAILADVAADKIKPEEFSIRAAWEGFIGRPEHTLQEARAMRRGGFIGLMPVREAVQSGAFTMITGAVLTKQMMTAYETQPGILDQLVTSFSSTLRQEPIVGIQAFGSMEDVPEGKPYPTRNMAEKSVMAPEPVKRALSLEITEEAVLFDQTGQLLMRAGDLGTLLKNDRERRGMYYIQDLPGYASYYPEVGGVPTQTALYRVAASVGTAWYNRNANSIASTALEDISDLQAAMKLFNAMTNEAGDPLLILPRILLVPFDIYALALRIVNAVELREVTNTNTTSVSPNVIEQMLRGAVTPLWSPFMNDTSTWYLGDFQRQFVEQVVIPPQLREVRSDENRDIIATFHVRHKTRVTARGDAYVVKMTS